MKRVIAGSTLALTTMAAILNFGCVTGGMAVTSTPAATYVVVGRNMYSCQAPAGARPVCTQVTEQ